MGSWKLIILMAISAVLAAVAIYGDFPLFPTILISIASGILLGYSLGFYHCLEKLYFHIRKEKLTAKKSDEILDTIL